MARDWPVDRLRALCSKIGSGATPRGGRDSYHPCGIALIRSQNVHLDGFQAEGLAYIDDAQAADLANVEVQAGDVLLNITGESVCRVCQAPAWVLPARVNQHVAIVRPRREVMLSAFLRYYLASPSMQASMHGLSTGGATRRALTKRMIEGFPVPCPPLPEQRAIAHILGTLDDKIELNRRMSRTLEAMARTLFKSWFVDFDPVRAKAEGRQPEGMDAETAALFPDGFEDSRMGPIPRGWRVATLADVTTKIGSGATPRGGKSAYVDDGVALIRSQNVYDSRFVWAGLARITDAAAEKLKGVLVHRDDVLLNITGASILRTCVVEPDVLPARVNQHVAIVRPGPGMPARYIHFHLLHPNTKSYLLGMDAGASRQAVTKGHIESVPIVVPTQPVLQKFNETVIPLFDTVNTCRSQSRCLAALRDTLLPRLLSGEIRIEDAERFIEEVA